MLKFLRKYQSYILVVGGILLMIAFLLPETIQQLGRTPLGAAPMKVAGRRVSYDKYEKLRREYIALNSLLPGYAQMMGAGSNPDHWILINHEAEAGGYLAGKHDGLEFLASAAKWYAGMNLQREFMFQQPPPDRLDSETRTMTDMLQNQRLRSVMGETRLSEDEVLRAVGKLHGIMRMRSAYMSAPRFSDRRLALDMKQTTDAATIDYLFIPPDRELAGIADPDAATLQAHFDKYKTIKLGEGETGIGYLLPDRVKLAWMFVDRNAVQQAITPDPVEVRKRFVKQYPTGQPPAGQTEQSVMSAFETAVRGEQTEKVMKAIDVAFRTELEKATRKLDTDGEYKKIPATGWERPDFQKLRDVLVQRVKDATGTTIPAPKVEIRASGWLTKDEVGKIPGIGEAFAARGSQFERFADSVFKVRELAGSGDSLLQIGIPAMESMSDSGGGRYYYMVLDARKESAPDSIDEIKDKVLADFKRLAAFEVLKSKVDSIRQTAVSQGLETLAKSPSPDGKGDLEIKTTVRIDGNGVANGDQNVNHEDFRKAVLDKARQLDPLTDINTSPLDTRTVVVPIAKSQGIGAARITRVAPMTYEQFRAGQNQAIRTSLQKFVSEDAQDPYSLANLEARLKVEYMDGRKEERKAADKKDYKKTS